MISFLLSQGKTVFNLDEKLEKAWINSVSSSKDEVCKIQQEYNCFGFRDNFCAGCGRLNSTGQRECASEKQSSCPICNDILAGNKNGCYNAILNSTARVHKPLGIASAGVAGLLLLDGIVVCAL